MKYFPPIDALLWLRLDRTAEIGRPADSGCGGNTLRGASTAGSEQFGQIYAPQFHLYRDLVQRFPGDDK
jgi:hypothetical protein